MEVNKKLPYCHAISERVSFLAQYKEIALMLVTVRSSKEIRYTLYPLS